ncbi:MAG: Ig-like domain-containing protein, partial [Muribaculaceae bacterium]|nr:Ig-like domain-containing protein [Muribaculaceae bacterium]
MTAFSGNHKPFTGKAGVLVDLKVSVAKDFTGGYVEISKIIFTDSEDKDVPFDATSAKLGVKVTGITLNETEAELKVGEAVELTAAVLPESATDKTVKWSSDNEKVAAVDANGKVTAIALGEAIITATCGAVNATCNVTVVPTP